MSNRLLILLPITLVLLVVVQFLLSNDLASTGNSVFNLDQRIHALREENEILRQQVAVAKSLLHIEERAVALGLVPSEEYVTMPLYDNVAYR